MGKYCGLPLIPILRCMYVCAFRIRQTFTAFCFFVISSSNIDHHKLCNLYIDYKVKGTLLKTWQLAYTWLIDNVWEVWQHTGEHQLLLESCKASWNLVIIGSPNSWERSSIRLLPIPINDPIFQRTNMCTILRVERVGCPRSTLCLKMTDNGMRSWKYLAKFLVFLRAINCTICCIDSRVTSLKIIISYPKNVKCKLYQ